MLIKAVLFLATLATLLEYSQANLIQDLIERAIGNLAFVFEKI